MSYLNLRSTATVAAMMLASSIWGAEPNDSFATPTLLPTGVLSVADELMLATIPDTLLGARDETGTIYLVDDDGSPLGDGRASGLTDLSINSESIHFAISGFGDVVEDGDFNGWHAEQGSYEVFVRVYNHMGMEIDFFSETGELEADLFDVDDDFQFSDPAWSGGKYDVYIDNTVGRADVDFYTFTGLAPGAAFEAQTFDELETGIDTYLGWFDDFGELIIADADSGDEGLSFITGIVPSSRSLTFAVTGVGDENFMGSHFSSGSYELTLAVTSDSLPGDLNNDSSVDAADYVYWRKNSGLQSEYELWHTNFGRTADMPAELLNVPEPASWVLLGGVFLLYPRLRRISRRDCLSFQRMDRSK